MRVQCCVCKKFLPEKPPYEDDSISHTYCDKCFEAEMSKMRKVREELKLKSKQGN